MYLLDIQNERYTGCEELDEIIGLLKGRYPRNNSLTFTGEAWGPLPVETRGTGPPKFSFEGANNAFGPPKF